MGEQICFGVCFPLDYCAHADIKHADFSDEKKWPFAQISTVFNSKVAILYLQVLHSTALSTMQMKLFMAQFYDTFLLVYLPN